MVLALAALISVEAQALPVTPFAYTDGDVKLEGRLVMPRSRAVPAGLVLILPDWDGVNDYEIARARQVAEEWKVPALAVDIYGVDNVPKSTADNARLAGMFYADRPMFRKRVQAAYDAAAERIRTRDKTNVAVMGYCFGGAAALEFARAGAPVRLAISFHGGLATTLPAKPGEVKAPILIFHALRDPVVPRAQFNGFLDEMEAAGADFRVVAYNLRAHAFTKPDANDYDRAADTDSWRQSTYAVKSALGLP